MNAPVDLLLISWNRRHYLEKTLVSLLTDPADFRLYCWDNASEDGAADLIASANDPRIIQKHFSKQNVQQRTPCLWFFEKSTSDLVSKVDDDILLPHGSIETIASLLRRDPRFGMLGCWTFIPQDWDEQLASHKIMHLAGAASSVTHGSEVQRFWPAVLIWYGISFHWPSGRTVSQSISTA
jgi:GT2 family glycosyltransferase